MFLCLDWNLLLRTFSHILNRFIMKTLSELMPLLLVGSVLKQMYCKETFIFVVTEDWVRQLWTLKSPLWQSWCSRLIELFKLGGIKKRAGSGQGFGPFKVRILYKWILCFSSPTQLYLSVIQHSLFVRKLHVSA